MMMFMAVVVWEWIKANWKSLGWPLAVLFCFLWWTKVTPCEKQAQTVVQEVKQASQSAVRVQLVYRDLKTPCPDVIVDATSGSTQTAFQSVTQTVQKQAQAVDRGIFIGGGYIGTPMAQIGGFYGPLRLSAVGWTTQIGGLASVDVKF